MENTNIYPEDELYESADTQARLLMAEYVCDLIEANDPDLDLKRQVIAEAMKRISVHHLERFDQEVEWVLSGRKEGKA